MNRYDMLQQLQSVAEWDIVIIGGGATGLGAALDAATRGYKTLLVEQYDFAKGTSSRSTKLVHGGVRYLAQGNIKLVFEALRERGRLLQNAPHITSSKAFILPVFSVWEKIYYSIGLKAYDLLSGKLSLGKTKILSKKSVIQSLPSIQSKKLKGGILYYDCQFDDARLAMDIAATATTHGATILNYCKAIKFIKKKIKKQETISGVVVRDEITNTEYEIKCKAVINATGVFTDAVMQMDDSSKHNIVAPSQGIHLVIDKKFFAGDNALMIPKTSDGRVLFAVPWHNEVVVGTTDTPVENISEEPKALDEEIDFVIHHFNLYCQTQIERKDIKSVYAGLRPLVKMKGGSNTSVMSRDHTIIVSASGLVNITGGKWTTFRKMAEDVVDNAAFVAHLPKQKCVTHDLKINNHQSSKDLVTTNNEERIHLSFSLTKADVIWYVRNEMALTVEDVLARRTRVLFLDAIAAFASAPVVADIMMHELQRDEAWKQLQTESFILLANQYKAS